MKTTPERLAAGFGFPLGCAAVVAAALVADVLGATRHPAYSLVALGAVVLGAGLITTPAAVAGVSMVAWAIHSGFMLGRAGQLVFDAATAQSSVVLAGIAVAGLLAGAAVRVTRVRPVRVPAPRRETAAQLVMLHGRHAG